MRRTSCALLLLLYVGLAALVGFLAFTRVRDFIASWELTGLEGITIYDATATPAPEDRTAVETPPPFAPNAGPQPVPWVGANRVTLLILGLDYRSWVEEQGPPLTDSMILLTVDPLNETAGMLSIPRDLWVNIPGGFGNHRINTAYRLGEQNRLPEGGPGLAMSTVEELLGVPVDYYALVEFGAFVRFIDEIGGVKIEVPEKIQVDPLGDDNTKTLKPGVQVLPGDLALAYIRVRKGAGDDFGRAQRQQQVILGIRDRILDFDQLPRLVTQSRNLYKELSAGIHTNLGLDQVIRLAWLGAQIQERNIRQGVIAPPDMVKFARSPDGDEVLKPIPQNIRKLRDEIFTQSGPISPATARMDLADLVQAEAPRVSILNGTITPNLATQAADHLRAQGMNVTLVENAPEMVTTSKITFFTAKPYSVRYLVDLTEIPDFNLRFEPDEASPVDIQMVLGADLAIKESPFTQP